MRSEAQALGQGQRASPPTLRSAASRKEPSLGPTGSSGMATACMRLIFQKVLTGRELWEEKKGKAMAGRAPGSRDSDTGSQPGRRRLPLAGPLARVR